MDWYPRQLCTTEQAAAGTFGRWKKTCLLREVTVFVFPRPVYGVSGLPVSFWKTTCVCSNKSVVDQRLLFGLDLRFSPVLNTQNIRGTQKHFEKMSNLVMKSHLTRLVTETISNICHYLSLCELYLLHLVLSSIRETPILISENIDGPELNIRFKLSW